MPTISTLTASEPIDRSTFEMPREIHHERPPTIHLSESELRCEKHSQSHVQRTKEGRCIVALPFNEKLSSIVSSKAAAMSRLASLHRRFQRDKRYEIAYGAVIQEYLDLGYMTKITTDHSPSSQYYLPHHDVIKESSHTTKLRVVFDGSASSTTGVSLYDTLHNGPKLQEDLFDVLQRFRSHQYVLQHVEVNVGPYLNNH